MNLNPTDGHIIAGVVLDDHRFLGRMRAAQLLQLTKDPRDTEDLKRVAADADLDAVRRIRSEVQRLFEGAKAKNVEPYARYIVAVHHGQPGMAPPLILWTERGLACDENPNGTARVLIPWDTPLVAIDAEMHCGWDAREWAPILDVIEEFLTGVPAVAADADRTLATVLFTDIVDSTKQVTSLGDRRWRQVLDDLDELVAKRLERFRGRMVKSTGDGHLALFDGPARAVRCATELCGAARSLGVQVRAGLHAGEVELRGDDVGGISVNIGARVSALAGPSDDAKQILLLHDGSEVTIRDARGEYLLVQLPGGGGWVPKSAVQRIY